MGVWEWVLLSLNFSAYMHVQLMLMEIQSLNSDVRNIHQTLCTHNHHNHVTGNANPM